MGWRLPEQYDEEWDCYTRDPVTPHANEWPPSHVAGRYDAWSNVWQVGLTMWSIITRYDAPEAPYAKKIKFRDIDGQMVDDCEYWARRQLCFPWAVSMNILLTCSSFPNSRDSRACVDEQ